MPTPMPTMPMPTPTPMPKPMSLSLSVSMFMLDNNHGYKSKKKLFVTKSPNHQITKYICMKPNANHHSLVILRLVSCKCTPP